MKVKMSKEIPAKITATKEDIKSSNFKLNSGDLLYHPDFGEYYKIIRMEDGWMLHNLSSHKYMFERGEELMVSAAIYRLDQVMARAYLGRENDAKRDNWHYLPESAYRINIKPSK